MAGCVCVLVREGVTDFLRVIGTNLGVHGGAEGGSVWLTVDSYMIRRVG